MLKDEAEKKRNEYTTTNVCSCIPYTHLGIVQYIGEWKRVALSMSFDQRLDDSHKGFPLQKFLFNEIVQVNADDNAIERKKQSIDLSTNKVDGGEREREMLLKH
jgi:hypothetical protein